MRVPTGVSVTCVLFGPTRNLPLEVITGTPEIGQAHRPIVDAVQLRERFVDRVEVARSLVADNIRGRRVPEDSPLYEVHHGKPRANHRIVHAHGVQMRDREIYAFERLQHACLALHSVRAAQKIARWLAEPRMPFRACSPCRWDSTV